MEIPNVDFTFIYLFMFFAVPGLVFRKIYYQGEFSKQFVSKNWAYTLTSSFVIGTVIQVISFYSVKGYFKVYGKPQNKEHLIKLSDFQNIKNILEGLDLYDFNKYDTHIFVILIYIIITCGISFFSALICWHFVRGLKLDRKFKLLRFGNIWNYYLRGEIIDFKDFARIKENKNVLLTLVDIIISDGFKENKLFSGVLTQYTINSTNHNLETITLTDTHVWKKDKNSESETFGRNVKVKVKGHCLILDVKKSIDLNLTYVYENKNIKTVKKKILNFLSSILTLFYLLFFVALIASSNPLLVITTSILYTILLKFYLITLLTFIFTIIINVISYIEFFREWNRDRKSKHLKGVIIIVLFTSFSFLLYRYFRYGNLCFWELL